jgi:hypothetical protein
MLPGRGVYIGRLDGRQPFDVDGHKAEGVSMPMRTPSPAFTCSDRVAPQISIPLETALELQIPRSHETQTAARRPNGCFPRYWYLSLITTNLVQPADEGQWR